MNKDYQGKIFIKNTTTKIINFLKNKIILYNY